MVTFLAASGINQAIPKFKEDGIDGELLLEAFDNEELFKEFTSRRVIRAKIRNKIEDYVREKAK